ncbi:MAG TPA: hypothetical protein VN698_12970 [Bacteroidia bacterium]|nr:hypothetical protein [Bacteroidia bacterium]
MAKTKKEVEKKLYYEDLTTPEAAFKRAGEDFSKLPSFDQYPEWYRPRAESDYVLHVWAKAINTNEDGTVWEPDFTDGTWKPFAAFAIAPTADKPRGGRFSDTGYGSWYSDSFVGSRLMFDTTEKVAFFQEHAEKYHLMHHLG